MNESAPPDALPSAEFLDTFRRRLGSSQALRFDAFMELALYDPSVGYYRHNRRRIGRSPSTDFYTSTSVGPLFGELVATAACQLLRAHGAEPTSFQFVELGVEPGGGIFEGVAHPFLSYQTVGVEDIAHLHGPCVVFSNELFDAQPCRRFIGSGGCLWREMGVAEKNGVLSEAECGVVSEAWLPPQAPEHYRLDAPRAAAALCATLALQPWHGLFLALDYGKSWCELSEQNPGGTIRAYFRHMLSNDILLRPGQQDITCHICWDWLIESLEAGAFENATLESQEAFFVKHAASFLAEISRKEAGRFSARKQALLQLLHPAHLGMKFQALHAWRPDARQIA